MSTDARNLAKKRVGVDVNASSSPLLTFFRGLSQLLATFPFTTLSVTQRM